MNASWVLYLTIMGCYLGGLILIFIIHTFCGDSHSEYMGQTRIVKNKRKTGQSTTEFVILLVYVYSTAIFHFNDFASDVATLFEYGNNNKIDLFIISILSILTYRCVSAFYFWRQHFGWRFVLGQLLDVEVFRQVYESHRANRYTKSLVRIKRFEAVFESFPQALAALTFILFNDNVDPIIYVSLVNSVISIGGSLSWSDDTSFKAHDYYTLLWFQRYFLRIFEVVTRLFVLAYVTIVFKDYFGIIWILLLDFLSAYGVHSLDAAQKVYFRSFDNVLMFLIAVPNYAKSGEYLGLYAFRTIECLILAAISGAIDTAVDSELKSDDRQWLLSVGGACLVGQLVLLYLVKSHVIAESIGDDIYKAARDGDEDGILDAVSWSPSILDKRDKLGMTPLHHAANSGHAHVVEHLCKCFKERDDIFVDSDFVGAYIDCTSSDASGRKHDFSPLYYATTGGYDECAKVLLH
eukprot:UN06321